MPEPPYRKIIFVCVNERPPERASCRPRGGMQIAEKLKSLVKSMNLPYRVRVSKSQCLDLCEMGPNVCVMPDNVWYNGVTLEDVEEIIRRHLPVE